MDRAICRRRSNRLGDSIDTITHGHRRQRSAGTDLILNGDRRTPDCVAVSTRISPQTTERGHNVGIGAFCVTGSFFVFNQL
jgi:hypothetical protein